jgi:hypothetical protein
VAVTQQLARLTFDDLRRCRTSVAVLDRLWSFRLGERSDYLDLDWSPRPLELAAAQVSTALRDAIREACSGGYEINPAYRDRHETIFEHPVRGLEPKVVRAVAAALLRWSPDDVVAALPTDPAAAKQLVAMAEFSGHPRDYLRGHYDALRRFYESAAAGELATANWWD